MLDLCDFMMMQKSPKAKHEKKKRYEMGGYADAEFAPLVELASHLVRSMHTATIEPESETFVRFRDNYEMKQTTTSMRHNQNPLTPTLRLPGFDHAHQRH